MPRNIVIACDGTNNEFGPENTNVVRLVQCLDRNVARQLIYYDPGLGTLPEPGRATRIGKWISKAAGLAFGAGLKWKIRQAYRFLMDEWEPGDRVFLIGFSRGSYTVRALAAFLHMFGLLPKGSQCLVPYAMRLFSAANRRLDGGRVTAGKFWELCEGWRETFARQIPGRGDRRFPVYFMGVWDTVSSVGWIWEPTTFPFTRKNPSVARVRHAVSIDERRWFFRQNLLEAAEGQDLVQLWFPGVHGDVGGGYPKDGSSLWQDPFHWMLCESKLVGLEIDSACEERVWDQYGKSNDPWRTRQHESLHGCWWLAEVVPKWQYRQNQGMKMLAIGLGRRRHIDEHAVPHVSTLRRMGAKLTPPYHPENAPKNWWEIAEQLERGPASDAGRAEDSGETGVASVDLKEFPRAFEGLAMDLNLDAAASATDDESPALVISSQDLVTSVPAMLDIEGEQTPMPDPGSLLDIGYTEVEHELIATIRPQGNGRPLDPRHYRVWFGTDRRPMSPTDYSFGFTSDYDGKLHCGSCVVHVPRSHQWGTLGSPWLLRLARRDGAPLTLVAIEDGQSSTVQSEIKEWLKSLKKGSREMLLFVHGYNVTFEDAALRAAQLGFDLKLQGPTVFYSWPSEGRVERYAADAAAIERSEPHFLEFLRILLSIPELEALNVIAHSMGNRLLYRTSAALASSSVNTLGGLKIGHIVLAAPDMDREVFKNAAQIYAAIRQNQRRTTLYWSREDRAVGVSQLLYKAPRAGVSGNAVRNVDSIRWIGHRFSLDFLGHSYFADAEPVLYDIRSLIAFHQPPEQRPRLNAVPDALHVQWWELG